MRIKVSIIPPQSESPSPPNHIPSLLPLENTNFLKTMAAFGIPGIFRLIGNIQQIHAPNSGISLYARNWTSDPGSATDGLIDTGAQVLFCQNGKINWGQ